MRILHLNEILKGEGQAFYFWNNNFELWVGVMAWTYVPTTWGWFLVHVRNTAHAMPIRAKNGSKKLKVVMSKSKKNSSVMPIQSWGKSDDLAYLNFGMKIDYFGHIFWDKDFKFVLPTAPIIYINIKGQT